MIKMKYSLVIIGSKGVNTNSVVKNTAVCVKYKWSNEQKNNNKICSAVITG